jgi:glycosyltransferase 2 family protein
VTVALLWFLFRKVDLAPIAFRLANLRLELAVVAIAILFGQLLLTGGRWYFVGQLVDAGIRLGLATRLILVGQFFNQVLPSSVGGDGVRAWLLSREGISIRRALASVICDRVAALLVLTVIVVCSMPIVMLSGDAAIPSAWPLTVAIDVSTTGGLLFLWLWGGAFSAWLIRLPPLRPLGVLIRDLRRVLFSNVKSLWVVGLSLLVQTMVVTSIYFLALALGVQLRAIHMLMMPLIMLISSIPVSFAGWGLRESVMVAGLGFAGISTADALAVSVSFGMAQLIIGLPGLAIAFLSRYDKSDKYAEI